MATLQHAVLSNVGWAAALALAASAAGRVFPRRPALAHGLWLAVLLKLVTPSLVQWTPERVVGPADPPRPAMTARPAGTPRPPAGPVAVAPSPAEGRPAEVQVRRRDRRGDRPRPWPWRTAAVVLWMAGTAAWGAAVVAQVSRFRRLLRAARPAPTDLNDRVGRLAALLGLRRAPAVWLVPTKIPPTLWALAGPPRLLLPEGLWGRLDGRQQDAVLVHELAHLKRRDHWVRWLEAVVLGLYWWDPVAWWARRQVEKAEEQCCDAWVVWALPGSAEAYAEALVATAVYLSGPRASRPLGATGVGRVSPLRRRLIMILREPTSHATARPLPRAALTLGALVLPFLPAWAPGARPESVRPTPVATAPAAKLVRPAAAPGGGGAVPGPATRAVREFALADVPIVVRVSRPLVREVSDHQDYVGNVEAARAVEVRARVGGTLDKVYDRAEQMVEPGTLLGEIDPRPYLAELEKAEAEVERSEARLKRWSAAMERVELLQRRTGTKGDDFDRVEGERDEARASLRAARAARDLAALALESTTVTAPIRGRVSRPRIAAGGLVVADTTVLATIDSTDPMFVSFNIDERTFLKLGREARKDKGKPPLLSGFKVLVGLSDEGGFPHPGRVDSVATRFEPNEGTIRCRAAFPDPDGFLLPGLSARVRLVTSAPYRVLLVTEDAVRNDQEGNHVFVIDDRDVVERRPVTLGSRDDGLYVVKQGLKEGEWVAVTNLSAMEAGATVKPLRIEMPPRPPARGNAR